MSHHKELDGNKSIVFYSEFWLPYFEQHKFLFVHDFDKLWII